MVEIYETLYPKLLKYHKQNKKTFSKSMRLTLSDTVDMLLEEILEKKSENKIYIGIDEYYQCLIDEIDNIVSLRILGYNSKEDFIIDALRRHIESILRYIKNNK